MPIMALQWNDDEGHFVCESEGRRAGTTNEEDLIRLLRESGGRINVTAFEDLAMKNGITRKRANDFLKAHAGREISVFKRAVALVCTHRPGPTERPNDLLT